MQSVTHISNFIKCIAIITLLLYKIYYSYFPQNGYFLGLSRFQRRNVFLAKTLKRRYSVPCTACKLHTNFSNVLLDSLLEKN